MILQNERQNRIRQLLAHTGRVDVSALTRQLNVTTMTIRRDLAAMEKAGILTRVHGGCIPKTGFVREIPFAEKNQKRVSQKLAIAREAVRRLSPKQSLYLDTGTTAVQVARALPANLNLRVFTNNLSVAMELFGRAGVSVFVYGGTLAANNPDLVGDFALPHIAGFRVDTAILGADALDSRRGEFYSADMATAALSRAARKQARKTFVLADSSKFGQSGLAVVGPLDKSITLFTDTDASREDRALLSKTQAEIVYVKHTETLL
ncbi:MAG: DeoR/GlpR family DNA-binding transcription regulator [Planctomycetota bacterium]